MPLSRSDSSIFGGTSGNRNGGAPCSRIFRQNTARMLTMLGVKHVPKPPAFLLASKVIRDLQLPGTTSSNQIYFKYSIAFSVVF